MEAPKPNLEPLPYHLELRDYLKASERELWNWFASARGAGGRLQFFAGRVQQRMERTLRAIPLTNRLADSGALQSFQSFGGQ